MKRAFDIVGSSIGLLIASPVLLPVMILVWMQDWHSPFYVAQRVGLNRRPFRMVKMRSMVKGADKTGVDSTSSNDMRITPVGHFIRKFKLDELTQLWNVLIGDMSLVGPRPNVKRETDLYTPVERRLLSVKPGVTDFASIVFSDEGSILEGHVNPDIAYNQLIRPGKSLLGLFYIENRSGRVDVELCLFTLISIVSRKTALKAVQSLLRRCKAPADLLHLASRSEALSPMPPPGGDAIVHSRVASKFENAKL